MKDIRTQREREKEREAERGRGRAGERKLERLGRVKEPKSKRIVQIQPYRKCSVSQKY